MNDDVESNPESLDNSISMEILNSYRSRIILTYNHEFRCSICYSGEYLKCIYNIDTNEYIKINDIDTSILYNYLDESFILLNPCGRHNICVGCLRYLALNFQNHEINVRYPYIRCLYPFEECITEAGLPIFFEHNQIAKVLTDKEYNEYITYAEAYQFPGYIMHKCPMCNTNDIMDIETIQTTETNKLLIICGNIDCKYRYCYYCRNVVGIYKVECENCTKHIESKDPNSYNYYFHKNISDRMHVNDLLYKNNELTVDIVINQIMLIYSTDDVIVFCPVCHVGMYKTEACNTMTHCKVERCYACNRIGNVYKEWKLGDHWSEIGKNGCPRFDYAPYWETVGCKILCTDGVCRDYEIGDCTEPEHQESIILLNNERKRACIYHMVKSLLIELRTEVLAILKDKIHIDYVPKEESLLIVDENITLLYDYTDKVYMKKDEKIEFSSIV